MQRMTTGDIRATRPVLRPTPHGWLATSAPEYLLQIGVRGVDEEDARLRFRDEVEAWALLHDAPEPRRDEPGA